jgi:hypothetical protein
VKRKTDRRRNHLHRGERAFIPQDRIARIRHEESVLRSRLRRQGIEDSAIVHSTCHCGSIECVGVPISRETATLVCSSAGSSVALHVEGSGRTRVNKILLEVAHNPRRKFGALFGKAGEKPMRLVFPAPMETAPAFTPGRTLEVKFDGIELDGRWELRVLDAAIGDAPFSTTWWMFVYR